MIKFTPDDHLQENMKRQRRESIQARRKLILAALEKDADMCANINGFNLNLSPEAQNKLKLDLLNAQASRHPVLIQLAEEEKAL